MGRLYITPEKMRAVLAPRGISPKDTWPNNTTEKVWWKGECEHEWKTTYNHLQTGSRCPHCQYDLNRPNGIYHLIHPDFSYQYVGISYKPIHRLKQHKEDTGLRGELARVLSKPYEYTVAEIHETLTHAGDSLPMLKSGLKVIRLD